MFKQSLATVLLSAAFFVIACNQQSSDNKTTQTGDRYTPKDYVELKHPLPEGFANQIKFASWKQMSEKVWFIKV